MSKRNYGNGGGSSKKTKMTQQVYYKQKVDLPEKKGYDTDLTIAAGSLLSTTSTNGSAFALNIPVEGSGVENRIGRKINAKSIRLRGSALHQYEVDATTGNAVGNLMRMVVVWDKTPGGNGIPTFDSVFRQQDAGGTTSSHIFDPVNIDAMNRFQVLKDCVIEMRVDAASVGGSTNLFSDRYYFDEFVKLGRQSEYSANAGAAADIQSGGLFVYFRASVNSVGTNAVSLENTSFARLRFTG